MTAHTRKLTYSENVIRLQQLVSGLRQQWRVILKELSAFGIVGGINFAIDISVYQVMYAHLHQGALVSKVVSTTITTTLAYFMHRHWSFAHRARTGLRREYALFFLLSAASLAIGLLLIGFVRYPLGQTGALTLQVANIGSIGVGTIFRFWAYRRWVFPAAVAEVVEAAEGQPERTPVAAAA
jgi:putative flippase GtrA